MPAHPFAVTKIMPVITRSGSPGDNIGKGPSRENEPSSERRKPPQIGVEACEIDRTAGGAKPAYSPMEVDAVRRVFPQVARVVTVSEAQCRIPVDAFGRESLHGRDADDIDNFMADTHGE